MPPIPGYHDGDAISIGFQIVANWSSLKQFWILIHRHAHV